MDEPVPDQRKNPDLLSTILHDAGVDACSAIRVTGHSGLAPLIWLCRHGFDDVAYVRSGQGAPRDPGDVLLALGDVSLPELQAITRDHGRLRPGGLLIVQTRGLRTPDGRDVVRSLLERAGYRVERCIAHRSSEMRVARLLPAESLRKAA